MEKHKDTPSHTAQALQLHESAKAAAHASSAPQSTEDIKSLNQLLQWATANSTEKEGSVLSRPSQTAEQLRQNREWLDVAFPDMYVVIRQLVARLDSSSNDDRVEALNSLQEFFLDLNYATNIDKVGALDPVLRCASEDDDCQVRAAAVWVLGTAMQHLSDVKMLLVSRRGHDVIARRLIDDAPNVRAKAVMAASALLHHADESILNSFDTVGGTAALRACLADSHQQTRRRARFFLQHAPESGNSAFVESLISDRNAVAAFSASLPEIDTEDFADVEAAIGALSVLVDSNLHGLLQVAPELPGVLDELAARCSDEELVQLINDLITRIN